MTCEWHPRDELGTTKFDNEKNACTDIKRWHSFVFGGLDKPNAQCYEDIYVLSIPGFVWHRIQAPSGGGPRHSHQCVVVGGNKMLSIGGINEFDGWPGVWLRKDPFPNGLGILDLTELKWTNNFDPTIKTYDSPDVVKNWYAQGGKVEWSSPELKRMFASAENNRGEFFFFFPWLRMYLTDFSKQILVKIPQKANPRLRLLLLWGQLLAAWLAA